MVISRMIFWPDELENFMQNHASKGAVGMLGPGVCPKTVNKVFSVSNRLTFSKAYYLQHKVKTK
jgi:hypothetical protein